MTSSEELSAPRNPDGTALRSGPTFTSERENLSLGSVDPNAEHIRPACPEPKNAAWPVPSWLPTATLLRLLVIFVVAGGVFGWRIGRPAPWIDESATWQAVHRGWGRLLAMLGGSDAPMVPYYLLAKAWAALGGQVTDLRLLSAVAAAAAVSCLALLLARWSGWGLAFTASALLIGLAGFDRFAQEARPYALLALVTCASWLAWDHWRSSRTARAGAVFGLLTAALGVTHLFGLLILPAQILADRGGPARRPPPPQARVQSQISQIQVRGRSSVPTWLDRWWPGWRAARATAGWGLLGVLGANVQIGVALVNGSGPSSTIPVTPSNLWQTEIISLTASRDARPAALGILALAAVGATAVARPRWRRAVTPLLCWALLPLALAGAATVVQPNLLRARYWVGMLPPVAGLAAIGVIVIADAAARLLRRTLRTGPRATSIATTGVVAALIALNVAVQAADQLAIRSGAGHGEDPVAALGIATAAAERDGNPVVVSPTQGALVMSVVDAGSPVLRPLFSNDPNQHDIWPVERPTTTVATELAGIHTVHWLYREPGGALVAGPVPQIPPTEQAVAGLPTALTQLHFRIVDAAEVSPGWILATLTRS